MPTKKPWTVMVYLAADNNLKDFGVYSLQQMKAVSNDNINVLAEFDTGPMNPSKRYLFNGGTRFGSIDENLIQSFGPTNAADPENLAAFIQWGAERFPAEHYFVIVWGHGGGLDDDFPRAPDNTFVQRHNLLNLTKGALDVPMKGALDVPMKGALDVPMKGALDVPMKAIATACNNGNFHLQESVVAALQQGISHALDEGVLTAAFHLAGVHRGPLTDCQRQYLASMKQGLLPVLKRGVQNSTLPVLHQSLLQAVTNGVFEALQNGVVLELQKKVLEALDNSDSGKMANGLSRIVEKDLLHFLDRGIADAMKMSNLGAGQSGDLAGKKSLAFVDHPTSYLSNLDLRDALKKASAHIGKIDIFGMDACNMNMMEIAYELRDSVRFMVASQDDIPDASWPYDRILDQLVNSPDMLPRDLAGLVTSTYVTGYRDYQGEQVTLSALDLDRSSEVQGIVSKLAATLAPELDKLAVRRSIVQARQQTRSFGLDQFADFRHFCERLAGATGDLLAPRGATEALAPFAPFVVSNRTSADESNCNGTSIYFPQFDPQRAQHQKTLGKEYEQLDFARHTGWDKFVTRFLRFQEEEWNTAMALLTVHTTAAADEPQEHRKEGDLKTGHGPRPNGSAGGAIDMRPPY